jgi:molybdate transport system regulatory protein
MRAETPRRKVIAVEGSLWLGRNGKAFAGAKRIGLLEGIDRTGSITRAAKEAGLSYKGAWDSLDAMNNLAQRPLVIRTTGGLHGGGSQITEYGRELIRLYRLLESGHRRLLSRMQAQVHDLSMLNELMKAIAMKTSARNQFWGKVKAIHKGAVNADVVLDVGGGLEIFANITNEAVQDLDLKPGREAAALIKASFVLLSPDPNVRISARNRLRGKVVKVIPGSVNGEVKVQLAEGRTLTAILTNDALQELRIAEGDSCTALVKASHVLIAVNS